MGGVNDAGVALVTGEVVSGTPAVGSSDNYFYVNGHLVSLPGSPLSTSFNVGEIFSGINNNQKIVLSVGSGSIAAETYLGRYDTSTNLNDGAGGAIASFSGPGQLKNGGLPSFFGEGLGINDSDVIVGFFTDTQGIFLQQENGDQSHVFTINGPPGAGFSGNPWGNLEHEYGFVFKPGVGYTLISAGSSSNVVNGSNDPSPGVSYFGGATPTDGVAYTVLTDINNAGIAVGYYMDGKSVQHSFIYNSNTHAFTFLPDLTYPQSNGQLTSTVATAINNEGIVVGYYGHAFATNAEVDPNNSVQSFVYDSNTGQFLTTNFTLPGGGSIGLTGINDNGMVTGESGGSLIVASLQPVVTIDDGGTLYLTQNSYETVHFAGGTGELVLSAGFNGEITGFNGTGASASLSDVIDLVGINYVGIGELACALLSDRNTQCLRKLRRILLSAFPELHRRFRLHLGRPWRHAGFRSASRADDNRQWRTVRSHCGKQRHHHLRRRPGKLQLDNPSEFTGKSPASPDPARCSTSTGSTRRRRRR